jgi:pimeloyl-ACP methyl ester carboxylesterase
MAGNSPDARRVAFELADGQVAGWRWPSPSSPRLVFCHANGFCASAYKIMLARLAATLDVTAIDLRGHGRTRLPADPDRLRDWRVYADDVRRLLDLFARADDRPILVAGHSLGGAAGAIAGVGAAHVVGAALLEPVALPPMATALWRLPLARALVNAAPLVRGARARRAEWPDRAAVIAAYAGKPLFRNWVPGALEAYLEDGLTESGGGVRLSCAPQWEAATFAAQTRAFWPAVRRRTAPMAVLAAAGRDTTVPRMSRARFRRSGVAVAEEAGAGHLLPMEAPEAAAAFIAACAAKWAGAPALPVAWGRRAAAERACKSESRLRPE